MAFQTPITIKEAIDNIRSKKYLLPSIQRELVWGPEKIEKLFDSLMRDYPIGSFLFWNVDKSRVADFTFYEFVKNFHERDNKHNVKADPSGAEDVTGILDGQQRLTSLYIGFAGSYSKKDKARRWNNDLAFPKRYLYLNLLERFTKDEDLDLDHEYDFQFLTKDEADYDHENEPETYFWFKVSDTLGFDGPGAIGAYLLESIPGVADKEKARFANDTLFKLYDLVHNRAVINYFLEKHGDLDKVLNIFVRINSGGTQLSYADLLLSIASASWKKLDAREEILQFVDEISEQGDGFRFNQDFVLKTSLVLSDFPDIKFKVDNFNNANMKRIEENWGNITSALRLTINLIRSFGYKRETLRANNALIPIAYYLLKKGNPVNFVESSQFAEDRRNIQQWLIAALLKRAFSGQPDNILRPIRQLIQKDFSQFPLAQIIEEFRGKDKSIIFSDDDIEALFDNRYGEVYTFSTLAAFYPTLDFKNRFHVDHIFPRSFASRKTLLSKGLSEAEAQDFIDYIDYLPNLQLLEGIPNMEKSNKDFGQWLVSAFPDPLARRAYMERNFIPEVDLSLKNFNEFYDERMKLMQAKFRDLIKQKI